MSKIRRLNAKLNELSRNEAGNPPGIMLLFRQEELNGLDNDEEDSDSEDEE